MNFREMVHKTIPFPIRVEILRLRQLPGYILETPTIARTKLTEHEAQGYPFTLACLRGQFRVATDIDIRAAAAHYLYRKPSAL
jgi:hypothetical protein